MTHRTRTRTRIGTAALALLILALTYYALAATNVYVAQSSAGSADGSSCANARTLAGTTWTAGNIYHLCGTFTSAVTIGGSGTSGAHITVLGEPGANLTMATIPNTGGLVLTGRSFVDLDGQGNLIITGTSNGTASGRVNSVGIEASGHDLTIQGVTVTSLYRYTCCGSDSGGIGVYAIGNGLANIHVSNMIFQAEFAGVEMQVGSGGSNLEFDHITIPTPDVAWGIVPVEGFSNSSLNGLKIHDNDLLAGSGTTPGSGSSWCTGATDFNHLDPIHTWSQGSSGGIVNEEIYNNYIHGNFCVVGGTANSTAMIFWEAGVDGGSAPNTANVFNNLLLMQGGHPGDGAIYKQTSTAGNIYNNTINCSGADTSAIGMEMGSGGAATIRNNGVTNCRNNGYLIDGGAPTASNNGCFNNGGTNCVGTSQVLTNPNLAANSTLTAGSSWIGAATNLTSLGLTDLDTGKPLLVGQGNVGQVGTARPAVGAWDIGAYPFGVAPPAPAVSLSPTSLAFGNQVILTTSAGQSTTLTNSGTATLTISSITLTGTNAADFGLTSGCGGTLAASANCVLTVTFTPSVAAARTASISITDNASGSPHTVPLTGTGVNAIPPPTPHKPTILGSLPPGTQGVAYAAGLTATGATPPNGWSANPTPAGLTLAASTGVLSGTPTATGATLITFQLTDSYHCGPTDPAGCTSVAAPFPTTLTVNSPTPPPPPRYTWTLTPAATSGLTFASSSGSVPPAQSLTVDDNSPASQPFVVSTDAPGIFSWTVSSTGSGTPAPATKAVLSVKASPSGLAAGTYPAHITLTPQSSSGLAVATYPVTLTVAGAPQPPSPPVPVPPVTGTVTGTSVKLTWAASPTPSLSAYHVLRGVTSGGPYTQIASVGGTVLTYTDSTVAPSTTYYYVVRSADGTVESANSNQATAVIPAPPPPPPTPSLSTTCSWVAGGTVASATWRCDSVFANVPAGAATKAVITSGTLSTTTTGTHP